jgi:hypothetical protein
MNKYNNKEKKEVPKYKVDNLNFFNSKNLMMQRPIKNFDHKMLRLFKITKVNSTNGS